MGAPALAPHGTISNDVIQVNAGTLSYGLTDSNEKCFITPMYIYTNVYIDRNKRNIITSHKAFEIIL